MLCVACREPSPAKFCPTICSQAKWEKVYEPREMLCSVLGTSPEESQLKTRTRSSASQDSCTPHARLMPAQMMKGMEGLKSHSRATQQRQRFNPNRSLSPFTCCCDKKPAPHLSVDMAEWNPVPLRPYPAHSSQKPLPRPWFLYPLWDLLLLLFCLPQQGRYGLLTQLLVMEPAFQALSPAQSTHFRLL